MATAVISGRVDVNVRDRANAYIHAAGLTAAEVIKNVWETIALTGEVPQPPVELTSAEAQDPFEAFVALCDSLDFGDPKDDWLATLTKEQMRDVIAQGKWEKYERL